MLKSVLLATLAAALLALHLDFWNWNTPDPLLFGIVPIGLWWQAAFALACSVMMYLFVKFLWPTHLETLEHLPPSSNRDAEGH